MSACSQTHIELQVKPDYSDLETVVKDLLGDPDRMQRITDTAFQRLLSHASVSSRDASMYLQPLYSPVRKRS